MIEHLEPKHTIKYLLRDKSVLLELLNILGIVGIVMTTVGFLLTMIVCLVKLILINI